MKKYLARSSLAQGCPQRVTLFSGSLCGDREDFKKMADLKGLAECLACTVASRYLLPLLCGNSQKNNSR